MDAAVNLEVRYPKGPSISYVGGNTQAIKANDKKGGNMKKILIAIAVITLVFMAGTVQAILTPDLPFGFPSLLYVSFFIGHGLVIVGVIYAVVVMGLRPTLASVGRALLATLAYAALIAPLNMALGTNYLYLRHKPEGASLMDYFGPWPWYLFVLLGVGTVIFLLCYAPIAVSVIQVIDPIGSKERGQRGRVHLDSMGQHHPDLQASRAIAWFVGDEH